MGIDKLIDATGAIGTNYLGLPRKALVCNAVSREDWNLRNKHSRRGLNMYTLKFLRNLYQQQAGVPIGFFGDIRRMISEILSLLQILGIRFVLRKTR